MSQQTQTGQSVLFAIKQALVHEEVNGAFELGMLEHNFYSDINTKMAELSQDELLETNKILRKLLSKRIAKITRMASLSKLSQIVEVKMSAEEKDLYVSIYNSCNMFKDIINKGDIKNE